MLEFAKRFCWNFHQIQDTSQEISETVIQFPKMTQSFERETGHWRCQNAKHFKRPQARVPLGLAFLQGSRKAAFKAEDQQLFANLYKDGILGRSVCFFFPEKTKMKWLKKCLVFQECEKNRSCKNTN